jgi:hypothetical protein
VFIGIENLNNVLLFSSLLFRIRLSEEINKFVSSRLDIRKYSIDNKSDYLPYYLAGLLEGDGHFNTPKVFKTSSGKSRCASIEVVFALKDRPLAELLKNIFGGNIYANSTQNLVRWMIRDLKSVTKIVNLINGKLRTPKINGFYNMIESNINITH